MDCFDDYAAKLHKTCSVADAHFDLVTEVYRRCQAGERGCLKNDFLEKLREGGVNLVFASLFLGDKELEECRADCREDCPKDCRINDWEAGSESGFFHKGAILKKALEMLACFLEEMRMAGGEAVLVTDRSSLCKVIRAKQMCTEQELAEGEKKWPVGIVLYLEGLDMLEGNPELLRCFYAMGVRGAALTWNKRPELPNPFAEGCVIGEAAEGCRGAEVAGNHVKEDLAENGIRENVAECGIREKIEGNTIRKDVWEKELEKGEETPITPLGIRVISLMEELGMFVDCSHLSDRAEEYLSHLAKAPYAATHSNAKALANHPRNLTDSQIIRLAGQGGVIGVNAYAEFVFDKTAGVMPGEFAPDKTTDVMSEKLVPDKTTDVMMVEFAPDKITDVMPGRFALDGAEATAPVAGICRQIAYLLKKAGEDHVGLGLDFGEGSCLTGYRQLPEITAALLRRGYPEKVIRKILGENWIHFLWKILHE